MAPDAGVPIPIVVARVCHARCVDDAQCVRAWCTRRGPDGSRDAPSESRGIVARSETTLIPVSRFARIWISVPTRTDSSSVRIDLLGALPCGGTRIRI